MIDRMKWKQNIANLSSVKEIPEIKTHGKISSKMKPDELRQQYHAKWMKYKEATNKLKEA